MGLELVTTKLEAAANWGRKFSLFTYPFVTACCGMEYMSVTGPRFDTDRFGMTLPRFTPRQSDLMLAQLCAENSLIGLRLVRQMPPVGDDTQSCSQAGRGPSTSGSGRSRRPAGPPGACGWDG